jgi:hypothetical protein
MRATFFVVFLLFGFDVPGAAQSSDRLALVPFPALTAEEAVQRCPAEHDTVIASVLHNLVPAAQSTDQASDSLAKLLDRLDRRFLEHARHELERQILLIGEEVDAAIRDCPKVQKANQQPTYDSSCVAAAEEEGYRNRLRAVNAYLLAIHRQWPLYLAEIRDLNDNTHDVAATLVRHVANAAAFITQTAAQFAR